MAKWIVGIVILIVAAVNLRGCVTVDSKPVSKVTPAIHHKGPLPVLEQNAPLKSVEINNESKNRPHVEIGTDDLQAVSEEERELTEVLSD